MRVVEIDQAVREVREHCASLPHPPRVVTSGNFATPVVVLGPVLAELPEARLHALNAQRDLPVHDGIVPETTFVGPGFRRHPRLAYVPCRLSMVPRLFHGPLAPDVVVVHTTLPHNGRVSLGLEVNVLPAAIEAARERGALVVAQLNPRMPWTFGDAEISVEDVDLGVEVDAALTTHVARAPSDDARLIGSRVAREIGDGATLQAGIGEVPDATIAGVLDRRDLRIWTEMFSDGVLTLEKAGALDRGTPVRTSFVFGSQELYDWVDDNPRVRMLRTETTNSPAAIAQQPAMTSINTALQVDLFDQANASRIGARIYSGFGGQTDFTVGVEQHQPVGVVGSVGHLVTGAVGEPQQPAPELRLRSHVDRVEDGVEQLRDVTHLATVRRVRIGAWSRGSSSSSTPRQPPSTRPWASGPRSPAGHPRTGAGRTASSSRSSRRPGRRT